MNNKRKRNDDDQSSPRVGNKVQMTSVGQTSSTSPFHYDTGRPTGGQLSHQVKYGPGIGFSPIERGILHNHYNEKKVTSRYTQYDSNRNTYVQAAVGMGRGLTVQERDVQKGRDPGPTSINHIIASGTGQHALNRATLEFASTASPMHQAAAIGRMRGFAREIMREETGGEGYGKVVDTSNMSPQQAFVAKRNAMSKDLLKAFEGGNINAYKQYMKHTFDSTGNLRLGHGSGNSRVSTGFDMPLDSKLQPTQRGERLLKAYDTFGYQDMMKDDKIGKRNTAGLFTTNQKGSRLSSSRQVSDDTVDHHRRFF